MPNPSDAPQASSPRGRQHPAALTPAAEAMTAVLDAVPVPLAVLDEERFITRANPEMAALAGRPTPASLQGLAMGDVLLCENKLAYPDLACGKTPACETCGINRALRDAHATGAGHAVCRFVRCVPQDPGILDLRVRATRLQEGAETAILVALTDLGGAPSQGVMRRIIFRDIDGAVGELRDLLSLVREARLGEEDPHRPDPDEGLLDLALRRVGQLAGLIHAQRAVVGGSRPATSGAIPPERVYCLRLLEARGEEVRERLAHRDVQLIVREAAPEPVVLSSPYLLAIVVETLLLAAGQAAGPGNAIQASCLETLHGALFRIQFPVSSDREQDAQRLLDDVASSPEERETGLSPWAAALLTRRDLGGTVRVADIGSGEMEIALRVPRAHPPQAGRD